MEASSLSRSTAHSIAWLTALVLPLLVALPLARGQWQADPASAGSKAAVHENYDIRDNDPTAAVSPAVRTGYRARQLTASRAAQVADLTQRMTRARASLQTALPTLQVETNPFGTAPEIVGTATATAFLTTASAASRESILRDFLSTQAAL